MMAKCNSSDRVSMLSHRRIVQRQRTPNRDIIPSSKYVPAGLNRNVK